MSLAFLPNSLPSEVKRLEGDQKMKRASYAHGIENTEKTLG